MPSDAICLLPATRLAELVRQREVSSRELLEMYLRRLERLNPQLNAVVTLDAERAFEAAARADHVTVSGAPTGPLHGLPITVKDALEVAGVRSTGGARELTDHRPERDAPAVERLRGAGAIVFGKTNVPRWSGDIQTYNDIFGTTNNPWDLSLTTGGSSGGAAAAVASGLTAFEVGTDIGGSIRIPSSFCGVCGHKPSYGIVSQRGYLDSVGGGVIDADINVFGPIARSVDDLAVLLGVLAGPDEECAPAWNLTLPPARHATLSEYRVGVWLDDPACPVEAAAVDVLAAAADSLARAGARVSDARPPLDLGEVARLFSALLLPAVSVSLDPEVGEALSGSHLDWLRNHRERTLLRRVWADWFAGYDALLCPVMPMLPFAHSQEGTIAERTVRINGVDRSMGDVFAWPGLAGLAYLPSTVVPAGTTAAGLPVGIQVVGPFLEDRTSLHLAGRLAELTGGYRPPALAAT